MARNPSTQAIDLLESTPDELMALFKSLDAPSLSEMDGEFAAAMLTQRNLAGDLFWRTAVYNPIWPGIWVGKAFRPVDETSGRGYNYFRHGARRIKQRFPMKTVIAPSRYDGKPAFQLVYGAYHSACGWMNMVDEVRKISDGKYLLIGTWGYTAKQRHYDSFFLLEGPVRPYRGDIGNERSIELARHIPRLTRPS